MLSPEIKVQIIAVLQARMIEDKAFQAVMAITKYTPEAKADQIAADYEKCVRLVMRRERTLTNMVIKQHNQESEAVQDDSLTH